MAKKQEWYRLDNAAKIYPVIRTKLWSPIFRYSADMKEPVDPTALQRALNNARFRFPGNFVRLRRGLFWYYFEALNRNVAVEEDVRYPCAPMQAGGPLFRLRYYGERVSMEFFHGITDGSGAMTFFKSVLAEYLRQKGIDVPCTHGVLDLNAEPDAEELEDSFLRFSRMRVLPSRTEPRAYHPAGTRLYGGRRRITTGVMQVDQLLERSRAMNVTITEYLAALMAQALYTLQKSQARGAMYPVKISVPVNLRKYYPTKTLRNFSQYINPGIDPNYGDFTFEETLMQIHHSLRFSLTEKNLNARMSKNVSSEQNMALRMVPLFIKKPVIFLEWFRTGERIFSMSFSNLGAVELPPRMQAHVQRISFVLNTARYNPLEAGAVSLGKKLTVTFASALEEPHVERLFFTSLIRQGVHVLVESNEGISQISEGRV